MEYTEVPATVTSATEAPLESEQPSGLPSEQIETPKFEASPEDFKDGKFAGRWNSPKEMSDYIKSMEDKHAELTRHVNNQSKQTDAEIETIANETKAQEKRQATVTELLPEYLENGMQMTDEIKNKLLETGITEQEIKLGAYEIKEAIDKNASYVGGKENYDIIMKYHAKNMTDAEKIQFNHSIQNPNNSEALLIGLQTIYERNSGKEQTAPTDRLRGNPAPSNAIKAYESKAELLRDKKYADSRMASDSDKKKFRARLNVTSDDVWRS